jgi:hypothetical protein
MEKSSLIQFVFDLFGELIEIFFPFDSGCENRACYAICFSSNFHLKTLIQLEIRTTKNGD